MRSPFRFENLPKALSIFLLALSVAAPARAIWSNDPAHNLVVADGASEQVQAKMVALSDGGFYVSWFDNAAGGYDVRLQRLSASGIELWPHNGVLVADRSLSSTTDYGLSVDADDEAILAFNDDSQATERIVAAKFSPDGQAIWGTPGVAVSTSNGFLASPRITGTDDGYTIVAWVQDSDTVLQKLDGDGVKLWAADGLVLPHSGDSFVLADLHATGANGGLDTGNVIVSWVRYVTFQGDKHLWAQKLDSDGAPLWSAGHVQVFDLAGGSLQFGNFPEFVPDGAGGAVFAWYTSSPALQVRAQRILGAGTEAFTHNGIELSTDGGHLRVNPSAVFDTASGDVTTFWVEMNTLQSQFGLDAQRLDPSGARLWGTTGKVLVPLGANEISQVRALTFTSGDQRGEAIPDAAVVLGGNGAIVAWAETLAFDNQPIRATQVDSDGTFTWSPSVRTIKSSATSTSRIAAAASTANYGALAWTDGESARDLKAQNLNLDGTLGAAPLFADGFESADTSMWSFVAP